MNLPGGKLLRCPNLPVFIILERDAFVNLAAPLWGGVFCYRISCARTMAL